MSPEAQRIAIAEACGWQSVREDYRFACGLTHSPGTGLVGISPINVAQGITKPETGSWIVPDYLNSLDAIFGAIRTMTNDQKDEVVRRVGWSAVRGCWDNSFIANATPAQWSRAFLQTLNLWTDDHDA